MKGNLTSLYIWAFKTKTVRVNIFSVVLTTAHKCAVIGKIQHPVSQGKSPLDEFTIEHIDCVN